MNRFQIGPGWRILLIDVGIAPEAALRRAQLPVDLCSRKDASLSSREYFRLWKAMEDLGGGSALVMRILDKMSVEAFDPAIFAALCSPNLEVAARRISELKPLIGPIRLDVETTADTLTLKIDFLDRETTVPGSLIAIELGFFVQLARIATRTRVVARSVTTPDDLPHLDGYTDFLGVTPRRGNGISISFSMTDARRPFVTANDAMWEVFKPELRRRLVHLSSEASMAERVRAALLESIPSGQSSADDVARRLAVSKRTLQRRLEEENASFKAILSDVREQLARHYVSNSHLPYGQISFLLGYRDPNSFFRAFNAWTGMTPDTARTQAVH